MKNKWGWFFLIFSILILMGVGVYFGSQIYLSNAVNSGPLPRVIIEGPSVVNLGQIVRYKMKLWDSSQNPKATLYWGRNYCYGHSDNWNILATSTTIPPNGGVIMGQIMFPEAGEYWVMGNVNDNTDTNRISCTGNPTYTIDELNDRKLTTCGQESYRMVKVIDAAGKTPGCFQQKILF